MPQTSSAGEQGKQRRTSKRASARSSYIVVQVLIGLVFVALYVVVSIVVYDDSTASMASTATPYFIAYVLGILSRYVPGVRSIAKRLK